MKIYRINNKIARLNSKWMKESDEPLPDYNPLNLPPYTIRIQTTNTSQPVCQLQYADVSISQVQGYNNVWDVTAVERLGGNITDWGYMFYTNGTSNVYKVLGANTTGVTKMNRMFEDCRNLAEVSIFDTTSVTDMNSMFHNCEVLTSVGEFNTSNVTDMSNMFYYCPQLLNVPLFNTHNVTSISRFLSDCYHLQSIPAFDFSSVTGSIYQAFYKGYRVNSGILAMYNQLSSNPNVEVVGYTFNYTGTQSETGILEYNQIPSSWGGGAS